MGLFRADSLARHLLQVVYDLLIRAVDKTYLIELVRDMPPFFGNKEKKLCEQKSQAQRLG
jgi:hypothetical protein